MDTCRQAVNFGQPNPYYICPVCSGCQFLSEVRATVSGVTGYDGTFILTVSGWDYQDIYWTYTNGTVTYQLTIPFKWSPSSVHFSIAGLFGASTTQAWPIDCSNFTITLTSGTQHVVVSNT